MKLKDMTKEQALKALESDKDLWEDVYSSCYEGIMWYMEYFFNYDKDGQYCEDYEVHGDGNDIEIKLIINDIVAEDFGEAKIKALEASVTQDIRTMLVSDDGVRKNFIEWWEIGDYNDSEKEYDV